MDKIKMLKDAIEGGFETPAEKKQAAMAILSCKGMDDAIIEAMKPIIAHATYNLWKNAPHTSRPWRKSDLDEMDEIGVKR